MDIWNNTINNFEVLQVPSGSNAEIGLPLNWSMCSAAPADGTGFQIPAASFTFGRNVTPSYFLGNIGNPSSVLLGFYPNYTGSSKAFISSTLPISTPIYGQSIFPANAALVFDPSISTMATNILLVSNDYTATRKFAWAPNPFLSGQNLTTSVYSTGISGASLTMPLGKSYSDIGVGTLIGWYGAPTVNKNSPFGITGSAIQFESAWLTQSGAGTYLNMAFFYVSGLQPVVSPIYQIGIIR